MIKRLDTNGVEYTCGNCEAECEYTLRGLPDVLCLSKFFTQDMKAGNLPQPLCERCHSEVESALKATRENKVAQA